MRKLKDFMRKAFRPRPAVGAAAVIVSAAGLAWCFLLGGEGTPASYVFYALSAYALAVVVVAVVPAFRAAWRRVAATRLVAPFVGSEGLRSGASAAWSVLFDLAYAAFTMATGFAYDSDWAVAVALYHVAIAGLGFALAFGLARARRLQDARREIRELRMARTCGVLLAVMALALSGVMAQMVVHRQAWVYGQVVVISSATFTFVNLGFAIASAVRVRTLARPALVASRAVSLSKTLVQLFFLETTMIAAFGEADGEMFRFVMEAVTGAVVFLLVLGIAVALLVFAGRRLRRAAVR